MKNNQFGFAVPALIAAVASVGMATMYVKQKNAGVSQQVKAAKSQRDQEQIRDAAVSLASRYKAVLAEKQVSPGVYAPAVYADDYFAYNWSMRKHSEIKDQLTFGLNSDGTVWMNSNGTVQEDWDRAIDVITGRPMKDTKVNDQYRLRITDTHRKKTGIGAGLIVESVDVEIKQQFKSQLGKENKVVRVRVPVPVPKPYDGRIYFRKIGASATFEELKNGNQIGEGEYEFEARASGIATGARLLIDGVEHKLGFQNFNDIYHSLRNYEAKGVAFPDRPRRDFSAKVNIDVIDSAVNPGHTDCRMSLSDESHSVQLQLISVDGTVIEYPAINMKTSNGRQDAGLAEYQNRCVAPGQCPYAEGGTETDGSAVGMYWESHGFGKVDDVSSLWNYAEAMRFGLKDRKLCMRLDPNRLDPNDPKYLEKADMITYAFDTCRPKFLHQRTACGCVAEDTLITLGDGKTQKRVDQLAESDLIWNPIKNKAMPMRKMTRGPEKVPMLKIFAGDKELSVTGNHPFPTRGGGMVTAFSMSEGQEIMVNGGEWLKVAKIEAIKPNDKAPVVWNIEIEAPNEDWDAHHYVANGVVTGDLLIQMALESLQKTAAND